MAAMCNMSIKITGRLEVARKFEVPDTKRKLAPVHLLHDLQNQPVSSQETDMCQQETDVPYCCSRFCQEGVCGLSKINKPKFIPLLPFPSLDFIITC
jgi:hypothetical protein